MTLFRSSFAARRLGRAPRRYFRPRLETLEDRLAPAGYSPTDLGTPVNNGPGNGAVAVAISDSGQIVASGFDDIGTYLYNPSSNGQGWQLLNPPDGYTQTFPKGINNTGQILVDAETQGGSYEVFLYDNGWTNLNVPSGFQQGLPQGINDSGEVFASTQTQNSRQTDLYSNGQGWQTNLSAPPGGDGIFNALGINKSGQLLAVATQGNPLLPSTENYFYDPTKGWTDLGTDGTIIESKVISGAINDSGQAFIDTQLPFSNNINQILIDNNVANSSPGFQTLNPPSGYSNTIPVGIDNAGQILVQATVGSGTSTPHIFLYDPNNSTNTWTDLNSFMPSGITLTGAGGINNNGEIVADGSDGHIYLLQPDAAPTVLSTPVNQTVTVGNSAILTASANGIPAPTVQWQFSPDGGTTWNDVGGFSWTKTNDTILTTLLLGNVQLSQNGSAYRAVFSNGVELPATTTAATLTVQTVPTITSGNSAAFTVGQSGSFTVTATGSPPPKWTLSGILPNGVTFTDNGDGTATLAGTPAAGTQGTYSFTIAASNGAGNDPQSFTLTVDPGPVASSPPSTPPSPPPPTLNVPPLLAFFDSLLGGTETVNANGTETLVDSLFGIALFVSTFDHSGNLLSVALFGINVTFLFA